MDDSIQYKISEIFKSIEGEGIRSGYPTVFVRFYGCNLHCSYCDTRYACEKEEYKILDFRHLISIIQSFGGNRVTLTGGEPLIQKDIDVLICELSYLGYEINIETNGSVVLPDFRCLKNDNVFVTVDYKCKSSNMSDKMIMKNYQNLTSKDVVKFVVGCYEDLVDLKHIYDNYLKNKCNNIFVSPVWGKIDPKDIIEFLLDNNLNDIRIQLQMHKLIWPVDTRGV